MVHHVQLYWTFSGLHSVSVDVDQNHHLILVLEHFKHDVRQNELKNENGQASE